MSAGELLDCTLLLVDDEEANLDLLEGFLAIEGYRSVVRVSDARQAVPTFESCNPDLVLLDLHMPHRSGFEVLEDICARIPAGGYLPVLVLTADATSEAKERALSRGARDFLVKPLDCTEVLLRVRNLLETRMLHRLQSESRERALASARRAALLADASRILSTSLDSSTVLSQLPRLLVPHFADACAIIADGAGEHTPAGEAYAHAEARAAVREALCSVWDGSLPQQSILRGVCPPDVSPGAPASAIVAPLGAPGGAAFGALVLVRSAERAFTPEDLALVEEIASRTALSVENARLFADAQWATRARERMLSVVAHDLRNPLTVVAMYAEMLQSLLPPGSDPYQCEALAGITQSADRMQRLINDLLDVSQLQQGSFPISPAQQSPQELFRQAAGMFGPLAERAGIVLTVRADGSETDQPIFVDSARVLQLLSNLVGNAIKFTPTGGSVTLSWAREGDSLRVAVADTGPGIPEEQLPHIFGAFWQPGGADRRGIGLGLWIAQAIVEAHGGRIWLDSRPGEGAVFRFLLPVGARMGQPTHEAEAVPT